MYALLFAFMTITPCFLSCFYDIIHAVNFMSEELENLTGIIEDIKYCNESNGYAIVEVAADGDYEIVVGTLGSVVIGEEIKYESSLGVIRKTYIECNLTIRVNTIADIKYKLLVGFDYCILRYASLFVRRYSKRC